MRFDLITDSSFITYFPTYIIHSGSKMAAQRKTHNLKIHIKVSTRKKVNVRKTSFNLIRTQAGYDKQKKVFRQSYDLLDRVFRRHVRVVLGPAKMRTHSHCELKIWRQQKVYSSRVTCSRMHYVSLQRQLHKLLR